MTYAPAVGSVPWRAIAYLQRQPAGAEVMNAPLAEAIGAPPSSMFACMAMAVRHGMVFRRQKGGTGPVWWSLTDHSGAPKSATSREGMLASASTGAAAAEDLTGLPSAVVGQLSRAGQAEHARQVAEQDSNARDAGQCTGSEAAQAPHPESTGPVAASTPTNGRPPARKEPEGAAAIAGGPETAEETTDGRDGAATAAANQPRAGDDAKPTVGAAVPDGHLVGKTATVSMTGEVAVVAECGTVILFEADLARQLIAFLAGRAG